MATGCFWPIADTLSSRGLLAMKVSIVGIELSLLAVAELPASSSHFSWNSLGEGNAGQLCGGQETIQALSVTRAG